MAPYARSVPAPVQYQVTEVERALAAGRIRPFSGRIVGQDGQMRQAKGTMSDADIARMNFFVQGVVGVLPGR